MRRGYYEDVFCSGDYVYATSVRGLDVFYVSGSGLERVGVWDGTGRSHGLHIEGVTAYIADDYRGLSILDISDPEFPEYLGGIDTPGTAFHVSVLDDIAYVADDTGGLRIIDVSDPGAPAELSSLSYISSANSAYAYQHNGETLVAVSDWYNGLELIDVTDPYSPSTDNWYSGTGDSYCWDACMDGYTAFIAYGESGLEIVDMAPVYPEMLANRSGDMYSVGMNDDLLAAADDTVGIKLFGIENPSQPVNYGVFADPAHPYRIDISGDKLYAAYTWKGIYELDISDVYSPYLSRSYENPYGPAESVALCGDKTVTSSGSSGVFVIDVTEPHSPGIPVAVDTNGYVFSLQGEGSYVYVCDGDGGLRILEPDAAGGPQWRGTYNPPVAQILSCDVVGPLAFIAGSLMGLHVVNISNPDVPAYVGSWGDFLSNSECVAAEGQYAYLAVVGQGLKIIDCMNPASPLLRGQYDSLTSVHGMDTVSSAGTTYLYIADIDRGLVIVNVTEPQNPFHVRTINPPGTVYNINVIDQLALVSVGSRGLRVYNVSDPANPQFLFSFDTCGSARDSVLKDHQTLFIADYYDLTIQDYAVPTFTPTPSFTATVEPTLSCTPTPTHTVPTGSPTYTPITPTETPTPFPSASPTASPKLTVHLQMPAHHFTPGSLCGLRIMIINNGMDYAGEYPVFVMLEIFGNYFFAPSWTEAADYYLVNLIPGHTIIEVIDQFNWPDGVSTSGSAVFWGAVTEADLSKIVGLHDNWNFSW